MFVQYILAAYFMGFPSGSDCEESACSVRHPASIPGLGRSPGEEIGNLLQYSCLENPLDRGAWQVTVHGLQRVRQTEQLTHTVCTFQISYPYIAPSPSLSPLVTTSLFSISVSLFLFVIFTSFFYFFAFHI